MSKRMFIGCVFLTLVVLLPAISQADRAAVPRTGQVFSSQTGDDGDLLSGAKWPNPRFTISNGTVTDNLTGLVWLQDSRCVGSMYWMKNPLASGADFALGTGGQIEELNQGNIANCVNYQAGTYTDWRMPNIKEMLSIFGYFALNPVIPNTAGVNKASNADPFYFDLTNIREFWTSTTSYDEAAPNSDAAFFVNIVTGGVSKADKEAYKACIWPVRGTTTSGTVVVPLF